MEIFLPSARGPRQTSLGVFNRGSWSPLGGSGSGTPCRIEKGVTRVLYVAPEGGGRGRAVSQELTAPPGYA